MKTHSRYLHKIRPGYVSTVTVVILGVILLMMLMAAYRYAVQSQDIQKRNQLYIDYAYREQATLRAVLTLAPNAAMKTMMSESNSNPLKSYCRWRWVFDDALVLADTERAVTESEMGQLGIPVTSISGNTADDDSGYGHPRDIIAPLSGLLTSSFRLTRGLNNTELIYGPTTLPQSLTAVDSTLIDRDDNFPIISTEKYYGSPDNQYQLMPYPNVHFGYGNQGTDFVAKRNWWAFSVHMGNESSGDTNLNVVKKDYVLSIYEVPSQLALGSTAMTNIGQHDDGTNWANVTIAGGAYAQSAETKGSIALTSLASRSGVTLSGSSSVGGISADSAIPTRETFEAVNNDFFPLTTSADSGLVAFIPINQGDDAYDNISNVQDSDYTSGGDNRLSPTAWSWYSRPAVQCVMKLKVTDVIGISNQTPTELTFTYLSGGTEVDQVYSRDDGSWPSLTDAGGDTFPFHTEDTPDGRLGLTVYLDRLEDHLIALGADNPTINHSLAVSADYLANPNVAKPSIPSVVTDTSVILRGTSDLTYYTEGFSLVSAFRMYLAEDVNVTPITVGGTDYPPLSLFAPEKRFGMRTLPMHIEFEGQINHLTKENSAVNPLDLKSGSSETVVPDNIDANLFSISSPDQLPPINQMNWLVVIEQVH